MARRRSNNADLMVYRERLGKSMSQAISPYREYPPSARLSRFVECFWTYENHSSGVHRVLPDGCADLLLVRTQREIQELFVVGTMTCGQLVDVSNTSTLGVRFRPGTLPLFIRIPGVEIVDQRIRLAEVWGAKSDALNEELAEHSITSCVTQIEKYLANQLNSEHNDQPFLNSTQHVLFWAERQHGNVRIDDLARIAGISTRHLRRVCLDLTGLTPKELCRAIRFRHAAARISHASQVNWADAALDSGYFDQAHFINEFRALGGLTPSEYKAELSRLQL